MAKHTEGPWAIEDEREDRIKIVGPNGELVADCCDGHYNDEDNFVRAAESLPNAHLIAAAPAMLGALQLVRMSRGWQYLSDESKAVIGAAIAKAEGA